MTVFVTSILLGQSYCANTDLVIRGQKQKCRTRRNNNNNNNNKKLITVSFFKEAVHQQIGGEVRHFPIEVSDGQTFDIQNAKKQIKSNKPMDQWTRRRVRWLSKNYTTNSEPQKSSNKNTNNNSQQMDDNFYQQLEYANSSRRPFRTHLQFLDGGENAHTINRFAQKQLSFNEFVIDH
eukprot:TRINITY_DN446_c1_g1_i9.p1 TRINITY_DN446_c1_g1~~TRINITY_DN446_c1_g1_i9.p1  ORF type:complete len:199 (-),score=11.91 TRINITY_DN446_c1_g1_i9:1-534(-)